MRRSLLVLVLLVLFALPLARAATPAGGQLDGSAADNGAYGGSSAGQVDVTSGHIYSTNLTGVQNTYRWVGVYGNITGKIVLADTSGDSFYNWTGAHGVLVYASTASSITWTSLADADASTVTTTDTWLSGSYADNYTNTFSGSEAIGSLIFTTLTSDYVAPYPSGSNWRTYSLTDGTNLVWAGKAFATAKTTYDGNTADYELMLPEDGSAGDTAATTYYFWVELK